VPNTIAAIAAIGTWAAVLAVVYLESLRPLMNRARLEIRVPTVSAHQITTYTRPNGLTESWQRLEVANHGRSAASNVEVSIIEATYDAQDLLVEAAVRPPQEFSAHLAGRTFKWSNVNSSIANIARGTPRLLDIVRLYSTKGRPEGYPSGAALAIIPESKVAYREHITSKHTELMVYVTADRLGPRVFRITIDIDDKWLGDQVPPQVCLSAKRMREPIYKET
jgi:hypothetical protein